MRTALALAVGLVVSSFAFADPGAKDDPFSLIHVDELAQLLETRADAVVVLDANPDSVRLKNGIVPGARLLSSSVAYDVAKELPSKRETTLVFYCANVH